MYPPLLIQSGTTWLEPKLPRKILQGVDDHCGLVFAQIIDQFLFIQLRRSDRMTYCSYRPFSKRVFQDNIMQVYTLFPDNTVELITELTLNMDIISVKKQEELFILKGNTSYFETNTLREKGLQVVLENWKVQQYRVQENLFPLKAEPTSDFPQRFFSNREADLVTLDGDDIILQGEYSLSCPFEEASYVQKVKGSASIEATIQFEPTSFQQMAGLLLRYDTNNQIYFYYSKEDRVTLSIAVISRGFLSIPFKVGIASSTLLPTLKIIQSRENIQFIKDNKELYTLPLQDFLDNIERKPPYYQLGLQVSDLTRQHIQARFSHIQLERCTDR